MTEFNLVDKANNKTITISFPDDYYDFTTDKEFMLRIVRKVYDLMGRNRNSSIELKGGLNYDRFKMRQMQKEDISKRIQRQYSHHKICL